MQSASRTLLIRVAGGLILLLAIAAALLPLPERIPGRVSVGALLFAAGAIELAAVLGGRERRVAHAVAAVASLLAGVRLVADSGVNFLAVLNLVILWLVVRAAALFFAARKTDKPLCNWVYLAAATDFALAVLLLGGLPVAVLVYGLFGTTNEIIATFSWIFAASFVVTGLLLLVAAASDGRGRTP